MPGKEISVHRESDKIVLEPIIAPSFDVEAWFAKLDSYRDIPFIDLPDDPPLAVDETISFD